jgi:transposase-like protein
MKMHASIRREEGSAGKRRQHSLHFRLRCLHALFRPQRQPKSSFSRRVILYARRFGISASSIWRWLALYRKGGADALRDHLRRDCLTRRVPGNVVPIDPDSPVRLPLDGEKKP